MRRSAFFVAIATFCLMGSVAAGAADATADHPPSAPAAEKKASADPMERWRASLTDKQRQRLDSYERFAATFQEKLRSSAEPRDWVLAAQGLPTPGRTSNPQDDELLVRNAASAAPADKLVQWMAANTRTGGGDSCSLSLPRPEAVSALQALEPDNGAAWALGLDAAVQAKDEAGIDDVLLHIAAAPRFDVHMLDATMAWISAYERFGTPDWSMDDADDDDPSAVTLATPATIRFTLAMAQASMNQSHFSNLVQACRAPKHTTGDDWHRAGLCEEVGRHIASVGTTLTTVSMGLQVIDSAGRTQPQDRAQQREMEWLREGPFAGNHDTWTPNEFAAMEATWRASGSQIVALRQHLQSAGYGAKPPAGWMSQMERYQAAMAAHAQSTDDADDEPEDD